MARAFACLVALAALALVPTASAHAHFDTDDGAYSMTIGHLNEPVYTYVKSGLDLTIRTDDTEEPVATGVSLTAVLIAPSGEEMERALKPQFGKPGSYTFDEAYVLTEPGQYKVRLHGTIGESPVDGTYNVSEAIEDQASVTFPDSHVPSNAELREKNAALETEVNGLQQDIADLEAKVTSLENKDSPAPAGPLLFLGLLALAAVLRRRA